MAKESKISWTDHTWNIARGCSKVDADCKYCYMFRQSLNATRYKPNQVMRTKTVFNLPLTIAEPSLIFTCSLTDFFHEDIDSYRAEAWDIIRQCPQHVFQILTKRPERIMQCLPDDWGEGWDNVWMGTSVGSIAGMKRLRPLLSVPARVHFVSFEPLYEDVNAELSAMDISDLIRIDWAIIGGESGNENGKYKYRPCNISWIEGIKETIERAAGSVFIKQLGTHLAKELGLKDRHGANMSEFPTNLKCQDFPIYDLPDSIKKRLIDEPNK